MVKSKTAHYLRRPISLLIATVAIAVLAVNAVAAAATNEIEGVWSFNKGSVAIRPLSNGTFQGIVVAETQFGTCPHVPEEVMWTNIAPQPDGSFYGYHQWFSDTSGACTAEMPLGRTAWRVLHNSEGGRFLRVCFSHPGTSQPTIAPDGTSANATYGCVDSALISSLPVQAPTITPTGQVGVKGFSETKGFSKSISLPSNKKCLSRRAFTIHLKNPANDPLKKVVVTIKGKKIKVTRHGNSFSAVIKLKGLPTGTFTVSVKATTILGHQLAGKRTYHTCHKKRASKPKRLRSVAFNHG
jgi:hypothetical protein